MSKARVCGHRTLSLDGRCLQCCALVDTAQYFKIFNFYRSKAQNALNFLKLKSAAERQRVVLVDLCAFVSEAEAPNVTLEETQRLRGPCFLTKLLDLCSDFYLAGEKLACESIYGVAAISMQLLERLRAVFDVKSVEEVPLLAVHVREISRQTEAALDFLSHAGPFETLLGDFRDLSGFELIMP